MAEGSRRTRCLFGSAVRADAWTSGVISPRRCKLIKSTNEKDEARCKRESRVLLDRFIKGLAIGLNTQDSTDGEMVNGEENGITEGEEADAQR